MHFNEYVDIELDVDEIFDAMDNTEKQAMFELLVQDKPQLRKYADAQPQHPTNEMVLEALDRIADNLTRLDSEAETLILKLGSEL